MSPEPEDAEELVGLEAELREAIQHRRAALQRVRETQQELEQVIERAKRLLDEEERESGASN